MSPHSIANCCLPLKNLIYICEHADLVADVTENAVQVMKTRVVVRNRSALSKHFKARVDLVITDPRMGTRQGGRARRRGVAAVSVPRHGLAG